MIQSASDADVQGIVLAGGQVTDVVDTPPWILGATSRTSRAIPRCASTGYEIRVGSELRAGKWVRMPSTTAATTPSSGPAGIHLLADDHAQEIAAVGWIATADGRIGQDVTLSVQVHGSISSTPGRW